MKHTHVKATTRKTFNRLWRSIFRCPGNPLCFMHSTLEQTSSSWVSCRAGQVLESFRCVYVVYRLPCTGVLYHGHKFAKLFSPSESFPRGTQLFHAHLLLRLAIIRPLRIPMACVSREIFSHPLRFRSTKV